MRKRHVRSRFSLLSELSPDAKRTALRVLRAAKVAKEHERCTHPGRRLVVELTRDDDGYVISSRVTGSYPSHITDVNANCKDLCDYEYRRDHCKHGSYVGTWDGPDILCGACEDGLSLYEYALKCAYNEQRFANQHIRELMWEHFATLIKERPELLEMVSPKQFREMYPR